MMRIKGKAILIAGAAGLTVAGIAYAGAVSHPGVTVNTTSMFFSGTLYGARNSSNTTESIRCQVYGLQSGAPETACFAINSAGAYASCTTYSAGIAQTVAALTAYSSISVYYSSTGECTEVIAETNSKFLP